MFKRKNIRDCSKNELEDQIDILFRLHFSHKRDVETYNECIREESRVTGLSSRDDVGREMLAENLRMYDISEPFLQVSSGFPFSKNLIVSRLKYNSGLDSGYCGKDLETIKVSRMAYYKFQLTRLNDWLGLVKDVFYG